MILKYIITDFGGIIFNEAITHSQVAKGFDRIYSAGFVEIQSGIVISAYGRSESLNIDSQPEKDEEIISDILSNFSKIKYNLLQIKEHYEKKNKVMDSRKFCGLSENKQRKLIGEKVESLHFGVGIVSETDDERIMIKVSVKCSTGKCKRDIYLTDAFTTGDLGNVYNKKGEYQGNVGNDVFYFCNCK
ncbi:MAG: hypothetical protein Q8O88_04080 [bacterium]|nr:hypothetical protein [bacterium]